jgi:uncharacterized protein
MRLSPKLALSLALTATLSLVASYESRAQTIASDDSAIAPLNFLPALAGDYFRLDSEVIGRAFHIYVKLPQSYDTDSSQAYPVVFVLDGDSLFPVIAPTHLFLNIDNGVPEAVIVGIAYGSFDPSINMRGYDFTASAPDTNSAQGGAQHFHMFLTEELIPLIERRYRVDSSRRILFGQSRGGGMVLYSAFSDPDVFWGRIANNPTFDPGREMFFSPPEDAARDDLGLVVTSGSNDMPLLREAALEWFSAWDAPDELPWRLQMVTIEGGTHASYSPDSYRSGILWLFGLND